MRKKRKALFQVLVYTFEVIAGRLLARERVHGRAEVLKAFRYLCGGHFRGTFVHYVLGKVRNAVVLRVFVSASRAYPESHRYRAYAAVFFRHEPEPVIESRKFYHIRSKIFSVCLYYSRKSRRYSVSDTVAAFSPAFSIASSTSSSARAVSAVGCMSMRSPPVSPSVARCAISAL